MTYTRWLNVQVPFYEMPKWIGIHISAWLISKNNPRRGQHQSRQQTRAETSHLSCTPGSGETPLPKVVQTCCVELDAPGLIGLANNARGNECAGRVRRPLPALTAIAGMPPLAAIAMGDFGGTANPTPHIQPIDFLTHRDTTGGNSGCGCRSGQHHPHPTLPLKGRAISIATDAIRGSGASLLAAQGADEGGVRSAPMAPAQPAAAP